MEGDRACGSTKPTDGEDIRARPQQHRLNIIYTNAQSIVNKINELRSVAYDLKPDIIMINESWTNSNITNAYLSIDGYELISRKDRVDTSNGRGGGLLLYAKAGLAVVELECKLTFNQYLTVSIATHPVPLTLNLVYRSPNSSPDNNSELNNLVRSIKKTTVTIGDMNFSGIDWEGGVSDSAGRDFFNSSQDAFLTQHVDFPTHEGNTIDLVLSTNDVLITSVGDVGNLGKSRHSILRVEVNANPNCMLSTEKVPDYRKADFNKMKTCISSVNWEEQFGPLNTFQCWDILKEELSNSMNECIPLKNRRVSNKPLWMNNNIMRLIRKKRRMWNWYKTTKDYAEYQAYRNVQKSVAKTIRSAKKKLERKLAKNFKKNPRQFYSHLNKHTKSCAQVGPLKNVNGEQVSDSEGMCDTLNSFFTSVFTKEDTSNIPQPVRLCQETMLPINIDRDSVKKKIANLKTYGAPGPDKVCPRVLQELEEEISLPLYLIFNKSLRSGEVPDDWKYANVTPAFKKGNRSLAENYRPISLTSIICKILESLIHDNIINHLNNFQLIRTSQHGFTQHRSCLTNLLHYLETVTTLLDEGHNVDVFYLDLSKAFDRVPHQRLLSKIRAHGISNEIFNWVSSWLTNRKQRVVLNGSCSSWTNVTSGVPQGSVLGPLLFIIFINDIDAAIDTIHCALFKFADDTKGVRCVNSEADALKLQQDLDNLFSWSTEWQMLFNLDKCHVLHLGNNNLRHEYNINGHKLLAVEEEKDLGVYITSSCTPSRQVSAAATKANQVLGQLLKSFSYRDHYTFIRLYSQYVRPHLEYCVQAWSPWLQQDITILENVQRRAVNAVSGLNGTYEEKLSALNLPSLEKRRVRGDMLQTFKMVMGIDDVNPLNYFTISANQHHHTTRQAASIHDGVVVPSYGLTQGPAKLELRRNSFSQRIVAPWNSLTATVKAATTVNDFKSKYDALPY